MKPFGSSRRPINSEGTSSFGSFFEDWLVRQEHSLDELRTASENLRGALEPDLKDLVDRVLSHYQQYYDEKTRASLADPFIFLSPPWLTRLEQAFLWVGGFKPTLAVEIVARSAGSRLTPDQAGRIEALRAATRRKEKEWEEKAAKVHESVASLPLLGVVRRLARVRVRQVEGETDRDGETGRDGLLREKVEALIGNADSLRKGTVLGVLEILDVGQQVEALAAAAELQLKIRNMGMERDAERRGR